MSVRLLHRFWILLKRNFFIFTKLRLLNSTRPKRRRISSNKTWTRSWRCSAPSSQLLTVALTRIWGRRKDRNWKTKKKRNNNSSVNARNKMRESMILKFNRENLMNIMKIFQDRFLNWVILDTNQAIMTIQRIMLWWHKMIEWARSF